MVYLNQPSALPGGERGVRVTEEPSRLWNGCKLPGGSAIGILVLPLIAGSCTAACGKFPLPNSPYNIDGFW